MPSSADRNRAITVGHTLVSRTSPSWGPNAVFRHVLVRRRRSGSPAPAGGLGWRHPEPNHRRRRNGELARRQARVAEERADRHAVRGESDHADMIATNPAGWLFAGIGVRPGARLVGSSASSTTRVKLPAAFIAGGSMRPVPSRSRYAACAFSRRVQAGAMPPRLGVLHRDWPAAPSLAPAPPPTGCRPSPMLSNPWRPAGTPSAS